MTKTFTWGNRGLELVFGYADGGPVSLLDLRDPAAAPAGGGPELSPAHLPLVELEVAGAGRRGTPGKRHTDGIISQRLQYLGHSEEADGQRRALAIDMADPETELSVRAYLETYGDVPVVRCWSEVTANGPDEVVLEHVSSFAYCGLARGCQDPWDGALPLWLATNPWTGEFQWSRASLRERGLVDTGMGAYGATGSKIRIAVTNVGSWSSSDRLPMGCLEQPHLGRALLWQIEHNGAWHAEVGDRHEDVYLMLSGPTEQEHQWRKRLRTGERFATVPVAVAWAEGGIEDAGAALNAYRRATRRPHADNSTLPVIFNDYMNCLMGDPSTERLLPLVDAAGRVGAEYFCIDAGWYDDDAGWWDSVGAWQPSTVRFPNGLEEVMDRIRSSGMVPGLWLEPEVVGTRSPMTDVLPEEAFFQRSGARITESGRHQLDFRHPAAVEHLDGVVDRLVADYGVGYLKLDYNIDVGAGTDISADSAGDGLLGHNRAYLDWLEGLLERHPHLVIENCASGGMRLDHAMLSRLPVQSLTDQRDYRLMASIAAAAPLAVTPEQAAVWAYPQPDFSDEAIAFTMASALLGRIHLSGKLDELSDDQLAIVSEAVAAYKGHRGLLPAGRPRWPLGLPGWTDPWVAVGVEAGDASLVTVWRRHSPSSSCELPLPWLRGRAGQVSCVFPRWGGDAARWDSETGILRVDLPQAYSARVLRLET